MADATSLVALVTSLLVGGAVIFVLVKVLQGLKAKQEERAERRSVQALSEREQSGDLAGAAELRLQAGQPREAAELFLRAGQPGRAARAMLKVGDRRRAAELFQRANEHERAAELYIAQGELDSAARALASSTEPTAQRRAAELLVQSGSFVAAGRIHEVLGDLAKAASTYLMASNLPEPDRPGRLLEQAARSLPKGAENEEKRAALLLAAAEAHDKLGVYEHAAELFKQINQPLRAGQCYEKARQYTTAAELYLEAGAEDEAERLRKIAGGELAVRRARYRLARARGDILDAAAHSAESGDFPVAVELLQQAAQDREVDSSSVEIYYRLADSLERIGRSDEAGDTFAKIEQSYPGYRDVASRLRKLGRSQSVQASTRREAVEEPASAPSPTTAPQLKPDAGERYELLEELGRGGMAVVYRARDRNLNRVVALKFLPEGFVSSKAGAAFRREAMAAAALNHPGIVTIHDLGTHAGHEFISMELVEGTTLEESLAKKGRLSLFETLDVIEPVLDALHYAHDRGVVHRDVKPSNIMRSSTGVRIMDFGLATTVHTTGKKTTIAGTPAYMAPEQFSGRGIDRRTDVFGVGATLYELLCGRTPYEEEDSVRLDQSQVPSPRDINPAVPRRLSDIVMKCIAFLPEDRYASAAELKAELQQVRKQLQAAIEAAMNADEG
ncbi:MAG: protein kinase [Deltaproteobacteria bacterium]|nr:protein kinase [Deltaproteobacteria bacterium]